MTGVATALEHEHRFPFPPNSNAMFYTHVAFTFFKTKENRPFSSIVGFDPQQKYLIHY
jgi:hypothetical protein